MDNAVDFLRSIGLSCICEPGAVGFLPGLAVRDGVLFYDPQVPVSNLLHEAGHLATAIGDFRPRAQSDFGPWLREIFKAVESHIDSDPDGSLARAALQMSDPEATAWAWAAGKHLGLRDEQIILDDEYDGDGANIRQALSLRRYVGIHGLAHAGFCVTSPRLEAVMGRPAFPKLAMWLQKDMAELGVSLEAQSKSRPRAAHR